jgi:hypothetical protein
VLYFAVKIKLNAVVVFCRGHYADVPDFEKFLQVFFIDEFDIFEDSCDGCAKLRQKGTQLRSFPIFFRIIRRQFGTHYQNLLAPKCGK